MHELKIRLGTYTEMISLNNDQPRIDAATPRTADETICVMGEVTLMESKLAMLIKNPKTPYINQKATDNHGQYESTRAN